MVFTILQDNYRFRNDRPISTTVNSTGSGTFNPATPDQNLTTLTLYDGLGRVISTTRYADTDLARTTITQYDAAGRAVTVTTNYTGNGMFDSNYPDRNLTQITTYGSAAGERLAQTEIRGWVGLGNSLALTTTYSYDNLGRLLTTVAPLTGTTVATTTQSYDALGRVTYTTDPLGLVTHQDYDGLGRVVTTTAHYVNGGPVDAQTNLRTVTTYDAAGNQVKVTDPKTISTQFQYDLRGRLVAVTDARSQVTQYMYDAAGNLLTVLDTKSQPLTNTYDLQNRLLSTTDALSHITQYTYDAAGNRKTTLDAEDQETTFAYNLQNRLAGITYPPPAALVTYTYDVIGRRIVMTDSVGTTTWLYDAADRPTTISQPFTGSVGYTYDSAGNRLALAYPDGKVVHYAYDLANRLVQVTDWLGQSDGYIYNAAGQPLTITLGAGLTTTYGYDAAWRLTGIAHTGLTGTLASYTYTLDAAGNRVSVREGNGQSQSAGGMPSRGSIASGAVSANGSRGSITAFVGATARLPFTQGAGTGDGGLGISYFYDVLYRLTDANYTDGQKFHYDYDAVGNIVTRTQTISGQVTTTSYVYDNANRLFSVDGMTYTWDYNGNLLFDGTATYGYDAANRLTGISQGGHTYAYSYNGNGDRLTQSVDEAVTYYTLDLNVGLTQVLSDGTNTYLYGLSRIGELQPSGFLYHLGDALGSVRQLVDSSGAVKLIQSYEPYGSVLSSSGSASSVYAFTGEMYDSTGLTFLRARYYSSLQGRFISHDTWADTYIKFRTPTDGGRFGTGGFNTEESMWPDYTRPQTLNAWSYVEANPINRTDPSGHCEDDPHDVNNTRAGCWHELFSIQSEYANRIHIAPDLWTEKELQLLDNTLSSHVWRNGYSTAKINFIRAAVALDGSGVAGRTEGGTEHIYNVTIYNIAWFAKPAGNQREHFIFGADLTHNRGWSNPKEASRETLACGAESRLDASGGTRD